MQEQCQVWHRDLEHLPEESAEVNWSLSCLDISKNFSFGAERLLTVWCGALLMTLQDHSAPSLCYYAPLQSQKHYFLLPNKK